MSIATKRGDGGQTGLIGGQRVSKADLRVESYGSIDELGAALGFARSLCSDPEIAGWTEEIQRTLFRVGSALATPAEAAKQPGSMTMGDVAHLTGLVETIETLEGIFADWSLPGAFTESAAYDVARTVCRRAERATVRFAESGEAVQEAILPYLNRLSDVLWLFGRRLEIQAGIESRLRPRPKSS